jgi:uncharacterized integral membrane protein
MAVCAWSTRAEVECDDHVDRRVRSTAAAQAHKEIAMNQLGDEKPVGRQISGGAIASLVGLAVLAIFVVQNTEDVKFNFLFLDFTWPLWLYTIVTALFGALVWFGFGVVRRHRRRKERRANR